MSKILNARNFRTVYAMNTEQAALRCAQYDHSNDVIGVSFE